MTLLAEEVQLHPDAAARSNALPLIRGRSHAVLHGAFVSSGRRSGRTACKARSFADPEDIQADPIRGFHFLDQVLHPLNRAVVQARFQIPDGSREAVDAEF